jgi:hypothetical protein
MNIINIGRFNRNDTKLLSYKINNDHYIYHKCHNNVCINDYGELPYFYTNLYNSNDVQEYTIILTKGTWRDYSWGDVPNVINNISNHGGFLSASIISNNNANNNKNYTYTYGYRKYKKVRNMIASTFCSGINVDNIGSKPIKLYNDNNHLLEQWVQFFPMESLCSDHLINLLKIFPYDKILDILINNNVLLSSPWYTIQVNVINSNKQCNYIKNKIKSNEEEEEEEHICKSHVNVNLTLAAVLHPGHSNGHKKLFKKLISNDNYNNSNKTNEYDENSMKKRIIVNRIIRDSRQLRFAVETKFENKNSYPLSITVFDVIPQFYEILFNTYSICILNINNEIDNVVS